MHQVGPRQLLADLGSMQRADTPERLERYLGRLSAVAREMEDIGKIAEEGATARQTVPTLVVDRAIAQVERLVATPPDASPAVAPVPQSDADGRERVLQTLREQVWPAYE